MMLAGKWKLRKRWRNYFWSVSFPITEALVLRFAYAATIESTLSLMSVFSREARRAQSFSSMAQRSVTPITNSRDPCHCPKLIAIL
jgi:hypothetical protein